MNSNNLHERVIQLHREIKEYIDLFLKQSKELKEKTAEKAKEYKDQEKAKELAFEIFMKGQVHQRDIAILKSKFVDFFDAFTLLESDLDFDEELKQTYNAIKTEEQKRVYLVTKGQFEEIEKGVENKIRDSYIKNNTFELLKTQFNQYIKDVG
ncbi:MAG: hypothetical protein CMH22_06300 [Methylophaga sp.]|nr:hypothetical protein [Methylophaga sp.]|tara:strand:- start:32502 stop:32960 length:459 start_codon:yes stop_codon:yes gene_type:complete